MNQNQKAKTKFRASKKWKDFRQKKREEQGGLCYVTHQKLLKGANLHHMDLSVSHYEDLSDPNCFVFVNKSIHDVIHIIYRYYEKDPEVLTRFCQVIQRMGVINGI